MLSYLCFRQFGETARSATKRATVIICTLIMAQSAVSRTQSPAVAPFSVAVHAHTGLRAPAGFFANHWGTFSVFGMGIDLPAASGPFSVRAEFDAGTMPSLHGSNHKILIMRQAFTVGRLYALSRAFFLSPRIGLSSTMVFPDTRFTLNSDPFASSESEFGLTAGAEPGFAISKLTFSFPASFDLVFSAPRLFAYGTLSFRIAGVF